MSSFLTKFINTIAQFPTRFFVGGVSTTIEQNWGITQIGTKDKAEYFNEIQKNGVYTTKGTKSPVTGGEVYTLDLSGYDDFGAFDINLLMTVSESNESSTLTLRIGSSDYPIMKQFDGRLTNLAIGELSGTQLITVRDGTAIIKIAPIYDLISAISGGQYGGHIQATGTKTAGNTYIDTNTGNIMLCINTTTSTSPNSDFADFTNKFLFGKVNSFDETTTFSTAGSYTFPNGETVNYGLTAKRRGNVVFYLATTSVTARGTGDSGFYTIFSGIPSEFQPTSTTHILLVGNYNEGYLRKVVISGGGMQMMSATYPIGSSIGGNASSTAAN